MDTCDYYNKIVPIQSPEAFLQKDVLATDTQISFSSGTALTSEWGFILFTGILLTEAPDLANCNRIGVLSCGACGRNIPTAPSQGLGTGTGTTTPTTSGCNPCTGCGQTVTPNPGTGGCNTCTGCGGSIPSGCDECDFCEKCEEAKKYILPKCPSIDMRKAELVLYKNKMIVDGCYHTADQLTRGLDIIDCKFIGYPQNVKTHPRNELVLVNDACSLGYRFDCIQRMCINKILSEL